MTTPTMLIITHRGDRAGAHLLRETYRHGETQAAGGTYMGGAPGDIRIVHQGYLGWWGNRYAWQFRSPGGRHTTMELVGRLPGAAS